MERTSLVYRIYDAADRLIYVGATSNLKQRLDHHRGQAWWWSLASRVTEAPCSDMETAFATESAVIRAERPAFNLLDRRGRSTRYQHRLTETDVQLLRGWLEAKPYRAGSLPMPIRRIAAAQLTSAVSA